jgi:adenine-specific DNA-methyltransferase
MSDTRETIVVRQAVRAWAQLANTLVQEGRDAELAAGEARRAVEIAAFLSLARAKDLCAFASALQRLERTDAAPLDDGALWSALPEHRRQPLLDAFVPFDESPPPVEILGRLHEQLLGRGLRCDAAGRWHAVVTRATRHAAGVFYTPVAIAAYIAEQVLARASEDGAVLDPACGCGAFLLAAYRRLRSAAALHGVDLDPEAVLVARRSLWLESRVGRGEEDEAFCLAQIRCADAITDRKLDDARGCFAVILGNPPYRRELGARDLMERLARTDLGRRCRAARMDLWYYFLHRGLELLRPGGRLGYIVGSYWTAAAGAAKLIAEIRGSAHVKEIVCLPENRVFPQVGGRQLILSLVKQPAERPTLIRRVAYDGDAWHGLRAGRGEAFTKTPAQLFRDGRIDLEPACDELLAAIDRWPPLSTLGLVRQGIVENPARVPVRAARSHGDWRPGEGVFVLRAEDVARLSLAEGEHEVLRPYHVLTDLDRYWMADKPSRWLIYATPQTWPQEGQFPRLRAHLARFRDVMDARRETRVGRRAWWHLHWPREEAIWTAPKLIAVQMAPRPAFVPALGSAYVPFSVNVFVPGPAMHEHLYYLAGVLNSRLLWTWYRHHAKRRGIGLEINGHVLGATPMRRIDMANPAEREQHDAIVDLVAERLALEQRRHKEHTACREIEPLEAELDRRVEMLYGVRAEQAPPLNGH